MLLQYYILYLDLVHNSKIRHNRVQAVQGSTRIPLDQIGSNSEVNQMNKEMALLETSSLMYCIEIV